ncbi:N-acetyl-gamma-glutamyl-phosphate reductase [Geobacter metallireducens RCH3]|uniref:N-acetyl-gamma-glutamyl-phosphate reductase n=1 Tax=Geobacter metallireducens (strain ATCC 53774 / DSM 7210 / GS-15) TaxID=269799 RepID=ARGC_GEOMG|nr:N-acetyl-gamma-glutamyl-phosphate reductase [Geobacter metallireducens]Q39Y23.1 RecName: Full=N-acetyl-gamma-glutamyl-phosphate reductase; Short=AGPR; AltName: Full=N-acetyl-glutamate semialdehyde dehydrogenase; Short=NAGSA dehydrogenase [Geobacter metallireducens GS-15]ABB30851.1 N-acetyl-glutamyl-5-phosphate reductase [Geobacter metallireducens GS-15]EHP83926.1 N-acetyl-gamma-glutamyl-phosphate reductase [Geobacter metallireducens RCH3]
MLNVAVVGASGYTGVELLRLLYCHPEVAVTCITSEQSAGRPVAAVFPTLRSRYTQVLENLEPVKVAQKADLIFTALPHKAAMEVVPTFLELGKRVVDLSADYRFNDPAVYEKWYEPHMNPENLKEAVYGLPEIRREKIGDAWLVGNPGCYPTSVILGLMPLLKKRLIDPSTIIADSKSGVSGAGRGAKVENLYCEVNDGFKAYGVGGVHRHIPEIEQELSLLAGGPITITFTPHLVPMDRGILSTIYARLTGTDSVAELVKLYAEFYEGEPFVRVLPAGNVPSTAHVRGSNFCDIGLAVDSRTGRVIVVSAIDNLVKGAAGQAVQNMNIMYGFPETMGLEGLPLFP